MTEVWTLADYVSGRCVEGLVGHSRDLMEPPAPDPAPAPEVPMPADPFVYRQHIAERLHHLSEKLFKAASETVDVKLAKEYRSFAEDIRSMQGFDAPKEVALMVTRREPTTAREMTTAELEQIIANAKLINGQATRVEE